MEQGQSARLADVLNYEPEQYLSASEIALLRSTFKGNPQLIHVIRKCMIPTIADPSLPLEQVKDDAFLSGIDWMSLSADEAKAIAAARQDAIKFVAGGLIKIKIIAASEDENETAKAARRLKDSTK